DWIILILPGFVPFFISLVSSIGHDGYSPILQNLLCNPWCFISCVHRDIVHTFKSTCYIVIYCIPSHAVMNIPCGYFHTKHKSSFVAGCVCFVCKLPFMFSLDKHSCIWVCG